MNFTFWYAHCFIMCAGLENCRGMCLVLLQSTKTKVLLMTHDSIGPSLCSLHWPWCLSVSFTHRCTGTLPLIYSTFTVWILKGTGAQDCGAAMVFNATQALEDRQECRIVSLDIRGAFDSVWWDGLLQHL